ncbi:DUF998 domain-containing protein [Mariniflexile sp. HMF6888]|uniref:DUF998 domain-containing protein n=1 Tax=Mariniflexile sp. HMF6888 TaxID=3373086 RepID=UPI0037B0C93C
MLIVIFILPIFSLESYSLLKHTTSQLGGQNMPYAWIMNMVFIFLGLGSILASWNYLSGYFLHRILILIFGTVLVLTAFYSHAPIENSIPYNIEEDKVHSYLAKITGFSFTFFAIAMAFIIRDRTNIIIAIVVAIIDTLFSIIMFDILEFTGIFQRAIFILSFGWLIYVLVKRIELKNGIQ